MFPPQTLMDFYSIPKFRGLEEDELSTKPLIDSESSSKNAYELENTRMEKSQINCIDDRQATHSRTPLEDTIVSSEIQIGQRDPITIQSHPRRQSPGKVDDSLINAEEQTNSVVLEYPDVEMAVQDLLNIKTAPCIINKGIKLVGGCFKQIVGPGSTLKNIHEIYHEESITIFSPFFIATLPISVMNGSKTLFRIALHHFLRPLPSNPTRHGLLERATKKYGVFAHIDSERKLNLKCSSDKETLLVIRGITVFNLYDNHPWVLQDGDRVIWISTANIKNLDNITQILQNFSQYKAQDLCSKLDKLLPTRKKAIVTFGSVDQEKLLENLKNNSKQCQYSKSTNQVFSNKEPQTKKTNKPLKTNSNLQSTQFLGSLDFTQSILNELYDETCRKDFTFQENTIYSDHVLVDQPRDVVGNQSSEMVLANQLDEIPLLYSPTPLIIPSTEQEERAVVVIIWNKDHQKQSRKTIKQENSDDSDTCGKFGESVQRLTKWDQPKLKRLKETIFKPLGYFSSIYVRKCV